MESAKEYGCEKCGCACMEESVGERWLEPVCVIFAAFDGLGDCELRFVGSDIRRSLSDEDVCGDWAECDCCWVCIDSS